MSLVPDSPVRDHPRGTTEDADGPVVLTPSQKAAMKILLRGGGNVFVTGGPGTGKSFLIRQFLLECPDEIPVIASTGAAAILVGGRTFHSYFGLGIMQGGPAVTMKRAMKNRRLKKRLREAAVIVIDEVSMLSCDALDSAEKIARAARQCDEPWGGIRVIAVGDFAQLPPITSDGERQWCFLSEAWKRSRFEKTVLTEVMRTADREFLEILEEIRWGRVSERVEAFLNERVAVSEELEEDVPHVFPRRAQTDAFNRERLSEIEYPLVKFETEYMGAQRHIDQLKRDLPVPPVLELKKTALVMLRINDPKQRFVNGTVGTVVEVSGDVLTVRVGRRRFEIGPFTFSLLDADGEEVACAVNFPVSLAYANTIHKVQGTTLERVHASLRALWEPGQAYVALSRARSGKGITLSGWDRRSIIADECVRRFYEE